MDKFVVVTKPKTGCVKSEKQKQRHNHYDSVNKNERERRTRNQRKETEKLFAPLRADGCTPSSSAVTRHLLKTLSDDANPITHSDIYLRTDHITSLATGHQRSEGRGRRHGTEYMETRSSKLVNQLPEKSTQILRNVRVYINGFLDNSTDIEMKRIVTIAGGEVRNTASGATHIITSQQLSGPKTHKLLTTKTRIKVHVVRPEWITDSIVAGKRLPEREYSVIKNAGNVNLLDMLRAGDSPTAGEHSKSMTIS